MKLSHIFLTTIALISMASCDADGGSDTASETSAAEDETGTKGPSESESTETSTDASNDSGSGMGGACAFHEHATCTLGPCGEGADRPDRYGHCGSSNLFDEHGCMRAQCEQDSDCLPDEVCYSTFDCFADACVPSSWACEGSEGDCSCGGPGDCAGAGSVRWCIARADVPCER